MTIETLRLILFSYLLASFLLAVFYLRNRKLSFGAYMLWGLFALLIPALGPFWVILSRPGKRFDSSLPRKGKKALFK
jgi:hypothetical protein